MLQADRIIDPEVTLRRTVQYGLSHYPEMDKEEQYARFRKHLTDKYAEGGYLKLWIPNRIMPDFMMIRPSIQYSHRPINLLNEYQPDHLMRKVIFDIEIFSCAA